MNASITKETIEIETPSGSLFFNIGENDPIASEPPVVSDKIKTRRDPLRRKFDKILERYGIVYIKFISDVIHTACEKPTSNNILKAKKAELSLQLKKISNEDVAYLLMFDYPVRLADYQALSY